ncbi:MAG TPA: hypothetical protein VFH48_42050 [Chloroflexota bacterium]|nr:hypothetical protein [Chloroflexota bacterium]
MAAYGGSFAHVAESVAHRAANLLAANVMVVDEHDILVARARPTGNESFATVGELQHPEIRTRFRSVLVKSTRRGDSREGL